MIKPIFIKYHYLRLQVMLCLLLSLIFMTTDAYTDKIKPFRNYANQAFDLVYNLAGKTVHYALWLYQDVVRYQAMNQNLRQQLLALQAQINQVDDIRAENDYLQRLLAMNHVPYDQKPQSFQVARVISVADDPFTHEVMIDKGSRHGIKPGFTLMDAYGIAGQVIEVHTTTSRVLLISDERHAIPVRINRNYLNLIAEGISDFHRIMINQLPENTDIKMGDVLVSSGLGNRFPRGYQVAEVVYIASLKDQGFVQVIAKPLARLHQLAYLLVIPTEKRQSAESNIAPDTE